MLYRIAIQASFRKMNARSCPLSLCCRLKELDFTLVRSLPILFHNLHKTLILSPPAEHYHELQMYSQHF